LDLLFGTRVGKCDDEQQQHKISQSRPFAHLHFARVTSSCAHSNNIFAHHSNYRLHLLPRSGDLTVLSPLLVAKRPHSSKAVCGISKPTRTPESLTLNPTAGFHNSRYRQKIARLSLQHRRTHRSPSTKHGDTRTLPRVIMKKATSHAPQAIM
jgi:hypothetical protein